MLQKKIWYLLVFCKNVITISLQIACDFQLMIHVLMVPFTFRNHSQLQPYGYYLH